MHGGVRAFLQEKDQEAGGQAAQQGQQDDKERIPEEHAPQGHLYGHGAPVDVASGTFFTDEEDFWLDGPVPLSWERTWYSRSDYRGPLGNGWHHAYDMGVVADTEEGTLTLRMSDGIPVAFPCLQRRNPRSSSPSARRPVWNRTAATACGTWPRTSTTASRARSTIPCACLRA